MKMVTDQFRVSTKGETDIKDITSAVAKIIAKHKFQEGQALVFVSGSTAGITTVEFEPGLLQDLPIAFEKIAPEKEHYFHEDTWHDGNGHSHVRASLLGCSLPIPFANGELTLGTWQQVVLIDFDNRPRDRSITVQLTGE